MEFYIYVLSDIFEIKPCCIFVTEFPAHDAGGKSRLTTLNFFIHETSMEITHIQHRRYFVMPVSYDFKKIKTIV